MGLLSQILKLEVLLVFLLIEFQLVWHIQWSHKRVLKTNTTILIPHEKPSTINTDVLNVLKSPIISSQSTVLCVIMREPSVRPLDIAHPNCHFFANRGMKQGLYY